MILTDAAARDRLADLVGKQEWVSAAPSMVAFCGNNRRQRLLDEWTGKAFATDHLDAFFNATVDAAIALGAFVTAAETIGLGCCPISAVRNRPQAVSELLHLPDHVFPVAGLAVGYPRRAPDISMRLPLRLTVQRNAYQEQDLRAGIEAYAGKRAQVQPYEGHRSTGVFGLSTAYDWIEDKVRQHSLKEREGFSDHVRKKGFCLDQNHGYAARVRIITDV